jgi:hypothetical protein
LITLRYQRFSGCAFGAVARNETGSELLDLVNYPSLWLDPVDIPERYCMPYGRCDPHVAVVRRLGKDSGKIDAAAPLRDASRIARISGRLTATLRYLQPVAIVKAGKRARSDNRHPHPWWQEELGQLSWPVETCCAHEGTRIVLLRTDRPSNRSGAAPNGWTRHRMECPR